MNCDRFSRSVESKVGRIRDVKLLLPPRGLVGKISQKGEKKKKCDRIRAVE